MRGSRIPLLAVVLIAVGVACLDPVQSRNEERLGPEAPGVRDGPLHRPGQQCTACHNANGSGPEFVAGGTIYERRGSTAPIAGVTVSLKDRNGVSFATATNEVGNFYISPKQYSPTYPLDVELQLGGFIKRMETQIGRDGGCALCHAGNGDASHAPAVFLKDTNE
jgi:hypothetical protein